MTEAAPVWPLLAVDINFTLATYRKHARQKVYNLIPIPTSRHEPFMVNFQRSGRSPILILESTSCPNSKITNMNDILTQKDYVGFWSRFAARMIDFAFIFVLLFITGQ
jgi:hypothetical protein